MCYVKFFSFRWRCIASFVFAFVILYVLLILRHSKIGETQLPIDSFQNSKDQQKVIKLTDENNFSYNSTCSHAADRRGPHQKVIAYSLYGDFSRSDVAFKYLTPLKRTISSIPRIYPGWVVRIYHNWTRDEDLMLLVDDHVDLCNSTEIIQRRHFGNLFAMTWRWLPLLDVMVDALMSRDSDSPITSREEEAVREWLVSDKIFHLMRDHPAHCVFGPILGGCWGVKINRDRPRIIRAAKIMFTINHLHTYDYDQILLENVIWPIALTSLMAHDSYCCELFLHHSQPFPKQRKDRIFVGARALGPDYIIETLSDVDICPLQCRLPNIISRTRWRFC